MHARFNILSSYHGDWAVKQLQVENWLIFVQLGDVVSGIMCASVVKASRV